MSRILLFKIDDTVTVTALKKHEVGNGDTPGTYFGEDA